MSPGIGASIDAAAAGSAGCSGGVLSSMLFTYCNNSKPLGLGASGLGFVFDITVSTPIDLAIDKAFPHRLSINSLTILFIPMPSFFGKQRFSLNSHIGKS